MNRREALTAGGAGVVGLLLPREAEAGFESPLIRGLKDEEMAQLIAGLFQSSQSRMRVYWDWHHNARILSGIEIYTLKSETDNPFFAHWVEGLRLHSKEVVPANYKLPAVVEISSLRYVVYGKAGKKEKYSRLQADSGPGWFRLSRVEA